MSIPNGAAVILDEQSDTPLAVRPSFVDASLPLACAQQCLPETQRGICMQERPAVLFLVLAALILAATPAAAETAPSAADVAFAAQKSTFLALPEATRKAVQDALVWLGFYNGVSTMG
jgi:hypothetical protein